MALVDDDVAEVVGRIELAEEARVGLVAIDAQRLVGGDVDAGVLRVVACLLRYDFGGVCAEAVLQRCEALGAQFVAVAEEQRAPELPASAMRLSRLAAMNVLPVPVASESSARFPPRANFSSTARMAASW